MTSIIATATPWRAVCICDHLVKNFAAPGAKLSNQQKANNNWLRSSHTLDFAVQGWLVHEDGMLDSIIVKDGSLQLASECGLVCLLEENSLLSTRDEEIVASAVIKAIEDCLNPKDAAEAGKPGDSTPDNESPEAATEGNSDPSPDGGPTY